MYNYFLKARVSLRTLSSLVINLFTQVAIVLELALVSSQLSLSTTHLFSLVEWRHSLAVGLFESPTIVSFEISLKLHPEIVYLPNEQTCQRP